MRLADKFFATVLLRHNRHIHENLKGGGHFAECSDKALDILFFFLLFVFLVHLHRYCTVVDNPIATILEPLHSAMLSPGLRKIPRKFIVQF